MLSPFRRRTLYLSRRSLHVCILTGEPSGDEIGSHLIAALQHTPTPTPLIITGIGGQAITNTVPNFQSLFPMSDLTIMGTTEILTSLPKLLFRTKEIVQHIVTTKPDCVVTIDSKGFNFNAIKWTKHWLRLTNTQTTTKFIHYVAPSIWAYRKQHDQSKWMSLYDHLCVILPFEKELFESQIKTTYVGHPSIDKYFNHIGIPATQSSISLPTTVSKSTNVLSQLRQMRHSQMETSTDHEDSGSVRLLLLPGSRMQEVLKILPIMKESITTQEISPKGYTIQPIVVTASSLEIQQYIDAFVLKWNAERKITNEKKKMNLKMIKVYNENESMKKNGMNRYDFMATGDIAVATSGTAVVGKNCVYFIFFFFKFCSNN